MQKLIMAFLILVGSTLNASANAENWVEIYREDNITVKTLKNTKGVMPFKAEGIINHSLNKVTAALRDYRSKHLWSPKLKSVKMHEEKGNQRYVFSEYYKTPWPASDREFLLEGNIKDLNKGAVSFEATSIDLPGYMDKNHVQAKVHKLNVLLETQGKNSTKVTFEFHGDLGGWIPTWLMNVIQKKWPLRFIQGLSKYIQN